MTVSAHPADEPLQPVSAVRDASGRGLGSLVHVVLIALLAAGAWSSVHIRAAGDPHVDSSIFITGGRHLNAGKALYTEVWDHKQPMIFWLNAAALRLGGGVESVRAMEKLFAVASVLLMYAIVWRVWRSVALSFFAATLFCYQFYWTFVFESGNLTEEYAVTFVLAGILSTLLVGRSQGFGGLAAAGAAGFWFSLATFTKEPFLLSSVPWFVYLVASGSTRVHVRLGNASSFVLCALIPLAVTLGYVVSVGALAEWCDNFSYSTTNTSDQWEGEILVHRSPTSDASSSGSLVRTLARRAAGNLRPVYQHVVAQSPVGVMLLIAGLMAAATPAFVGRSRGMPWVSLGAFVLDYCGTMASPRQYPHYYMQLAPAFVLLATCGLQFLRFGYANLKPELHRLRAPLAPFRGSLIVGLVCVVAFVAYKRGRPWRHQLLSLARAASRAGLDKPKPISNYLIENAKPGDTLWATSGYNTSIQVDANLLSPTRYFFVFDHLFVDTQRSSAGEKLEALRGELESNPPRFVVVSDREFLRATGLIDWIEANYSRSPVHQRVAGRRVAWLYLRNDEAPAAVHDASQDAPAAPGEGDSVSSAKFQQVLVVHDSRDKLVENAYLNAVDALEYAKFKIEVHNLANGAPWPDLERYTSVLLMTESLHLLDDVTAGDLADYVAGGGGLVVLPPRSKRLLNTMFGTAADPANTPASAAERPRKCLFTGDLMPGADGLVVTRQGEHNVSPRRPQDGSELGDDGWQPAFELRRLGEGRVLAWNSLAPAKREARGLVVQSVMAVQPLAVQPIANAGVIQIDDFPAGFSEEMLEPVATQLGLTNVAFYRRHWLPDMLRLSAEFEVPYSCFIPFNYNGRVAPPYDFEEWERATVKVAGRRSRFSRYCLDQVKSIGELGLHGYNHVSLKVDSWGSKANMEAALRAALERWSADGLGAPPVSYVPPMNQFDAAGAQALTEAMPSLRCICSSFSGRLANGGHRDFGPEVWNPRLFGLPRVTSGYQLNNMMRMQMTSALHTLGVWTHFLHPDDIFDNPLNRPAGRYFRNPKARPWRSSPASDLVGMYDQFRDWISFTKQHYPWLRYLRTDEASRVVKRHLENRVDVRFFPDRITVQSITPTHLHVRMNNRKKVDLDSLTGATLLHREEGSNYTLYTLEMQGPSLELPLTSAGMRK